MTTRSKKQPNANLFAALRAAFPADLDCVAVETDNGLFYSWRDLDRGSAMIANLLQGLGLVLVVAEYFADSIQHQLADCGLASWPIGEIRAGNRDVIVD